MASFIRLFGNRTLTGNDYGNYEDLLTLAVSKGYFVHRSCNTKAIHEFLLNKPDKKDFTSTFYKTWETIRSMNRYELLCDQLIYYFTRYNPNNLVESELPTILFENLKPIMPIEASEACAKCEEMLESGIALAKDTIDAIFEVFDVCKHTDKLNIEKIKNREARIIAFKRLDRLPTDKNEFVRFLVYLATGDTMLIKSRESLERITKSSIDVSDKMKTFGITKLASLYGRYKLIFMAFKHANKNNVMVVNKLTKMAKKEARKKSLKAKADDVFGNDSGYFQTLLIGSEKSNPLDEVKLQSKLSQLNNFKKITLLETINLYLSLNEKSFRVFSIRNGKVWVKLSQEEQEEQNARKAARIQERKMNMRSRRQKPQSNEISFPLPFKKYKTSRQYTQEQDKDRLKRIHTIVYQSLVSSLQSKYLYDTKKSFRLPNKCDLTAPRSDKAFVGEFPFGSSFSLVDTNAIVGISWDIEDNAADLDLSLLNTMNQKIGWNSQFKDKENSIIYSGDVVEAPGTELVYAANGFDFDASINVNLYRCINNVAAGAKVSFKFFVAREAIKPGRMTRNYMIDPNNICFSTKITMDSSQMLVGFITKNRFIFCTARSGDSRVSRGNAYTEKVIRYNLLMQSCHIDLRKLLLDAGFIESLESTQLGSQADKLAKAAASASGVSNVEMTSKTDEPDVFTFESKSDIISFFKN